MKKLILTIALAAGMALPMAATDVQADPNYTVKQDTILWQHSFGRGDVRCNLYKGSRVNRHWGDNWDRWIYVKITYDAGPALWGIGNTIFCKGWVDKRQLIADNGNQANNQSNNDRVSQAGNQNVGFVEMGTVRNSKWGNTIPIFKDRNTFFKARHSLNRIGHYNGQEGKVVCKIPLNYAVEFKQFKDWGVGEVKAWYKKRCIGWMDAGAVRNW